MHISHTVSVYSRPYKNSESLAQHVTIFLLTNDFQALDICHGGKCDMEKRKRTT